MMTNCTEVFSPRDVRLTERNRLPNREAVNQGVEKLDIVSLGTHGNVIDETGPRLGQVPRNPPRTKVG